MQDAIDLVEAAGFDIEAVNGIWNCAIGLKRYPAADEVSGDVEARRNAALEHPLSSFIWWIVARKTRQATTDLGAIVDRVVSRTFRPFVAARYRSVIGSVHSMEGTKRSTG